MTFKVGDRVRVKQGAWQVNARGKVGTIGEILPGGDVGVYFDGSIESDDPLGSACSIAGSPNNNGCYLLPRYLELALKGDKMKIGQYEVEVISKDEVKVGYHTFRRGNVEELLKWFRSRPALISPDVPSTLIEGQVVTGEDVLRVLDLMDNFTERLVPSKLPPWKLAIGGRYLFLRLKHEESNVVVRFNEHGADTAGFSHSVTGFDDYPVRILTDGEIKRMLEAVKP